MTDDAEFMYDLTSETHYELYYLMPGERLSPPRERGEWWKKYFTGGLSFTPSKVEAIDAAADIEQINDFKTKIVEVTVTRKEV